MKKPNFKKVTGKSMLAKVAIPLGAALLGSMVGAAAGKTGNLVVAGALGTLGVAMDQPLLISGAAGAVAVTPATSLFAKSTTAGFDGLGGLDGFKDQLSSAKNRALGQGKALLSNAQLSFIADKIPVSGLDGLGSAQDAYQMGYVEGVEDAVEEYGGDGVEGLAGGYSFGAHQLAPGGSNQRMSIEAMRMQAL